jgi:hypothetical protein
MFYEIDHQTFSLTIARSDGQFGVGLNGVIKDEHDQLWARCGFVTHSEFPDFDHMQVMETTELALVALQILKNGGHHAISKCRNAGLTVHFRLNSYDASQ